MPTSPILILGGTGKTGARIVPLLREAGADVRTAARRGADVAFDWDDRATHGPALDGVRAVYLVQPAMRLDHAPAVAAFLDAATQAGVTHVTLLSANGVDQAPPETAMRAIELDLIAREELTHTILRPAWFMQNFGESFFAPPIVSDGVVPAPTGDGEEAFVDAEDIAAVAAASLLDPAAHAGREYALTGPEALSFAGAAAVIGAAAGREVRHADIPRDAWLAGSIANGVPEDYAELLASLLDVIRAGQGTTPTGDVRRAIGREPGSLQDYAARTAQAWKAPAGATA